MPDLEKQVSELSNIVKILAGSVLLLVTLFLYNQWQLNETSARAQEIVDKARAESDARHDAASRAANGWFIGPRPTTDEEQPIHHDPIGTYNPHAWKPRQY